jgi:hypothetical protein
MANSSKRISELNLYSNTQFAPAWQTAVVPVNFVTDELGYPDTFKVPMSSIALNLKDGAFSGRLTVLGSLSANAPLIQGGVYNNSTTFIIKATTNNTLDYLSMEPTDIHSSLEIPIGVSSFFKIYLIGVSSSIQRQSTTIEFTGLLRRDNAPSPSDAISIVGTPIKTVHSRENLTTDAKIEANNITKRFDIKVIGGNENENYHWTGKIELIHF